MAVNHVPVTRVRVKLRAVAMEIDSRRELIQ